MQGPHQAGLRSFLTLTQNQGHGSTNMKLVEAMIRNAVAVEINFLPIIQGDEAVIGLGF